MDDVRKEFDEKLVKFRKDNEARFYEFGRRIASFDPMIADLLAFKKDLEDVRKSIANSLQSIQNDLSSIKAALKSNESLHSDKSSKLDEHSRGLSDIKALHDKSASKIIELNDRANFHSAKIESLNNQSRHFIDVESQFNTHKKSSEAYSSEMASQIVSMKKKMENLSDIFCSFNVTLQKYQEFTNQYSKEKSDFKDSIDKFGITLQEIKASFSNDLYQKFYECLIKCKDMVDSVKIPDTSKLAAQDSIDKMSSRVDFLSMDSKNALLKTSNLDMQNQIVSKKLDTVMTILQKYELSSKL
jgi:chromosome segregation ATPase